MREEKRERSQRCSCPCTHSSRRSLLRWGSVNTEIKIVSVGNPELRNVLPLKPVAGKNIATHAWPTAKTFSSVS